MRSRTSNLLIRSQMLYPIELWPREEQSNKADCFPMVKSISKKLPLDPARLPADDFPSILSRVTEGLAR